MHVLGFHVYPTFLRSEFTIMFTVMLCVVILKVRLYIPVESWILLTSLLPFLSLSPSLPPIPHSLTYSLFLLSFTYSLPLPSFPFPLSPSSPFFLSLTHSLSSFPFPLSPPPPFLFHSLPFLSLSLVLPVHGDSRCVCWTLQKKNCYHFS